MQRLERALFKVYENRTLTEILKIIDNAIVFLVGYALLYQTALLLTENILFAVSVIGILALPFFAVTIARCITRAKRPYELFDFYEIKPKKSVGKSFPSRHAYSAFAIGVVLLWFSLPVGVGVLLLAALLSVIRVLLGIHFPRDVIAGALIGLFSGAFGMSLLSFIF